DFAAKKHKSHKRDLSYFALLAPFCGQSQFIPGLGFSLCFFSVVSFLSPGFHKTFDSTQKEHD
ncbi:MAG TPA: hypothetical protein VN604_11100, partial [Nitrospirota bacterium]|nr:hypothetical protein [Nitrospirota bacterium]